MCKGCPQAEKVWPKQAGEWGWPMRLCRGSGGLSWDRPRALRKRDKPGDSTSKGTEPDGTWHGGNSTLPVCVVGGPRCLWLGGKVGSILKGGGDLDSVLLGVGLSQRRLS